MDVGASAVARVLARAFHAKDSWTNKLGWFG